MRKAQGKSGVAAPRREDIFERLFAPPFVVVPVLVWFYALARFLFHAEAPVRLGRLPDADDYMILVDLLDALASGSWFDHHLARLDPPHGVVMHFSRLSEAPLAAAMLLLRPLLELRDAAWLAALVVPPLYFALFLVVLRWTLRPLMGRRAANLGSLLTLLFFSLLVALFQPGRVDHHALQLLLMCGAMGATLRWLRDYRPRHMALTAGLLALSLAVGIETLPWVCLFGAVIIGVAAWHGGVAAKAQPVFALTMASSALFALAITSPPSAWLVVETTRFSVVYGALLAGMALLAMLAAGVGGLRRKLRLAIVGSCGALLGVAYLALFPQLLAGPYGGVDPAQTREILGVVTEAIPWIRLSHGLPEFIALLFWPLLSLGIAVWRWRRDRSGFDGWALLSVLLFGAIGLGVFYQTRALWFAALFALPLLGWAMPRCYRLLARHFRHAPRRALAMTIGLACIAYGLVVIPALLPARDHPAAGTALSLDDQTRILRQRMALCDLRPVAAALNAPDGLGRRPLRLMAAMDDGPALLFFTMPSQHMVFAAPYHNLRDGNRLARQFFGAAQPETAARIAAEHGIDAVALCAAFPDSYLLRPDNAPLRHASGNGFASDIVDGKLPDWLTAQPLSGETSYKLFMVQPARLRQSGN